MILFLHNHHNSWGGEFSKDAFTSPINKIFPKKKTRTNFLNCQNKENISIEKTRKAFIKFPFFFLEIALLLIIPPKKKLVRAESLKETNNFFSTKSGLKIIDFYTGEGNKPEWGDFLTINYVFYRNFSGKLEKISDTYQKNTPFSFVHGSGQTIKGLEEAIHSMQKGGKRRVVISKELGYNAPGLGPIPPEIWKRKKIFEKSKDNLDSFVIFDIELIDIKKNNLNQKWFNSEFSEGKKFAEIFSPK